jgi:hypothetical protein
MNILALVYRLLFPKGAIACRTCGILMHRQYDDALLEKDICDKCIDEWGYIDYVCTANNDESRMTTRLEVRLPVELDALLSEYCEETGASKTGAVVMLVKTLEQKLAVLRSAA